MGGRERWWSKWEFTWNGKLTYFLNVLLLLLLMKNDPCFRRG